MAPSWIRTSNDLPKSSSSKPRKWPTSSRCPVEDTGRNSVTPSTMPRKIALITSNVIASSAAGRARQRRGCLRRVVAYKGMIARDRGSGFRNQGGNVSGVKSEVSAARQALMPDARYLTPDPAMLTLFHHPFCPHSRFVRLVLEELRLEPRLVEERTWERRQDFLALNPAGTTPDRKSTR